jgi:ribosomal protein L33
MIIAYIAWPLDNDTAMWAHTKKTGEPPPGVVCSACKVRTDWEAINPRYTPPRSYYDLSRCYDGDILVSPRLREYLERQQLPGLKFVELPASRRYFVLQCENVLKLARPSTLRMEEYCPVCKQHRSVWGIKSGQLAGVDEPIRHGLYFSDSRVGYYPQMGPELIVGVETWQGMVKERFKGLANGKPVIH